MIHPSTLLFLKNVKANNNRPWFEKNRASYEAALENVRTFVTELIEATSAFDKSIAGLTYKDCLMRIYRDVRFSKNKDPYKTNFGASINKGGRKSHYAGYYLHLEPGGNSFIAGGMHMPEPENLQKVRQEILYNPEKFKKIIGGKEFKKNFGNLWQEDKLISAPKNFPKDHPEIELLKLKSFICIHEIKDSQVLNKNFFKFTVSLIKNAKPLNDFLNTALD